MNLLFVGDVMLGRLVNDWLRREPSRHVWGDTLSLFQAAEARFANLECVIADHGAPWSETPKVFHFRSDARNVSMLTMAGMDFVSLANNHTLDFGCTALFEMLDILDRAGIQRAGAGRSIQEAASPAIFIRCGQRIGCIAFTDNQPEWEAATRPGVFYVPVDLPDPRDQALLDIVVRTRTQVDWLIVAAHWGGNWGYRPPSSHITLAHALIDNGADIVFGHSCHVFRGIEWYRSGVILYSCGDFVDDYRVDEVERNDQSFVFIVETEGRHIHRLRLYPTRIDWFQVHRAKGDTARHIGRKMQRLCAEFNTAAFWNETEACLEIPTGIG